MFRGIILNKDLENEILGTIPKDYSNVEKAAYIYIKMCRMLKYSVDYYVGKPEAIEFFREPENIAKIDGKQNRDVICYVFNAMLLEMLRKADLVDDVYTRGYTITDDDKFLDKHESIIAMVASFRSRFDGTVGYDNDCTRLKYSNKMPSGWVVTSSKEQECLNAAMSRVIKDFPIEPTEAEKFISILAERYAGKQKDYPLEHRVDMFIKSLSIAEYEMFGFHNLKTISQILFTEDELTYDKNKSLQDNIYYKTVKVRDSKELKAILGVQRYDKIKERNNLKIYEISLLNYDCTELTPEEYVKRIDTEYYVKKHGEELKYPEIVNNYLTNNKMSL